LRPIVVISLDSRNTVCSPEIDDAINLGTILYPAFKVVSIG
jgi:hypothetical protein